MFDCQWKEVKLKSTFHLLVIASKFVFLLFLDNQNDESNILDCISSYGLRDVKERQESDFVPLTVERRRVFYLFIFFSTIIHCEASVVVFLFILSLGTIFYFSIILIRRSKKSTLQYYILFILVLFACFTSKIKRTTFNNPAFWIEFQSCFSIPLPPKTDSLFIFRFIWISHLGLVVSCLSYIPSSKTNKQKTGWILLSLPLSFMFYPLSMVKIDVCFWPCPKT